MSILKDKKIENKELIIFDIDGTLVKYSSLDNLIANALQNYNIEARSEYFDMQKDGVVEALDKSSKEKDYFNFKNLCACWKRSLLFLEDSSISVEEFAKKMIDLETTYLESIYGVKTTLEELKQLKYKMLCSTNWFYDSQFKKLKKYDLNNYFKDIYTCEYNYAKPNPLHFEYILDQEEYDSERVLMVGDSSTDLSAKELGISTILVDYDSNKKYLYDEADIVITEFNDLKYILKR